MAYEIDVSDVDEALRRLPRDALVGLAEVLEEIERRPWDGAPLVGTNPHGAVRTWPFGDGGLVTYLVLEDVARVDVLQLHWTR